MSDDDELAEAELQAFADGIEAMRRRQDAYIARPEGRRICRETGGACPYAHLDARAE